MLSLKSSTYIFLICALIATQPVPTWSARRSRIDTPSASIRNSAAEAPVNDNVATASDHDPQVTAAHVEAPAASSAETNFELPAASAAGSSEHAAPSANKEGAVDTGSAQVYEECDPDMIGFEIITG